MSGWSLRSRPFIRYNDVAAVANRKRRAYYAATFSLAGPMHRHPGPIRGRRGITVLALVLLVVAVIVAIVLLTRYCPI